MVMEEEGGEQQETGTEGKEKDSEGHHEHENPWVVLADLKKAMNEQRYKDAEICSTCGGVHTDSDDTNDHNDYIQ